MFLRKTTAALAAALGMGSALLAQSNPEIIEAAFTLGGVEKSFGQSQTIDAALIAKFQTFDPLCGAICISPLEAAAGVQTVGEREVISFVATQVSAGAGLLVDSREPDDRAVGFIPASVNVPTSLVQPDNPYLADIMLALGARSFESTLNFSDAMPLIIFDAGPTTSEATDLITQLIAQGYPASKISYYRGGMLVWTALGLTTEDAQS